MTVQKDVTKNIYVGNGSTRTFPFTFECPAEHPEYIKVYLMQDDGTALATSDYQLDMDARQITYPSSGTALPEGKKLVIMRELPLQQMMNLVNNGPYFAEDVETAFDENVMAMQQIAEKLNRSIIMSVDIDGDAFVNEVPFEAGKSFRIADDGKSIVLTEDPAKVLPLAQSKLEAATAQANIAAASAAAAAKSENNAAISASASNNSAQSASTSAARAAESEKSASTSAASAAESARLAETAKSDASLYATNAKTSADSANTNKEAAQSAATTASNFATDARNSAGEAKTYKDNAKTYMDNAKNYSENVNVFTPSVSTSGVLSWTNKAGLANPPSVNIKGDKGDQGLQGIQGVQGVKGDTGAKGDRGATGAAATIRIGTVTTGASGSEAVVTNVGTDNDAVFNFRLPRGEKGADGGIEIDNALSNTSINPVQNKVIKAALDKKMAKTDKIYEANLAWGGRNIAGGFSPTDAAMAAQLSANHLMFGKVEGFTIEYSEDAGATWHEYPASDTKNRLFSTGNYRFYAGGEKSRQPSVNDMLRVTIDPDAFGVYSALNKFIIEVSTGGASGCYCTIDASLENSPNKFEVFADRAPISGWSGYNVINTSAIETYSNQPTRQYGIIRFTFGYTTVPTNPDYKGLALLQIMGFGGAGWSSPSNMAKHGHLYDFNAWQQAIFPDSVTATNFIGKVNGFDVKASVPANAKFINNEESNVWTAQQNFHDLMLNREKYATYVVNGTSDKPITSTMVYAVIGAFTLDLATLAGLLSASQSSVFTAYFAASADYALTITNAGTLKYVGSASDVAITSAGLLLNIWMSKDGGGTLTSIVQASKLS